MHPDNLLQMRTAKYAEVDLTPLFDHTIINTQTQLQHTPTVRGLSQLKHDSLKQ